MGLDLATAGFYINFYDPNRLQPAPIRGFGFYGIGIGDLGCFQLCLFATAGGTTDLCPLCVGGSTERGSVFFFGFIDPEPGNAHEYVSIRFRDTSLTSEDVFAFDRIMILTTPEPGSAAMLLLGGAVRVGLSRIRPGGAGAC